MIAEDTACYYGRRIGCLNVNDPNCSRCADALSNAISQMLVEKNKKN